MDTVTPDELLVRLKAFGVDIPLDPTTTHTNLGVSLNLNATVIGLGLEDSKYESDTFPGLVY